MERWEKDVIDYRKGSNKHVPSKLTDEERNEILRISNSEMYCNLPPCKIVPLLANRSIYIASESSFYRILREEHQLTHRQMSKPSKNKRPEECIAQGQNQVWSWDISYLSTTVRGWFYYLYFIVDIFSRKVVGWSIHETESSEHASNLIKQTYLDEGINPGEVILHSDNGRPMKGMTMLSMLESLGINPSFSRPSVSDDNPYSEALFRTTKYHHSFPKEKSFDTLLSARIWCEKFVAWYNNIHLHSGLKFITPEQRHTGMDKAILENRKMVYETAKARTPLRWSGPTRNWRLPDFVSLNPNRKGKNKAVVEN